MSFYVIQTIMGILGSIGFSILFGVTDRKLLWISLGSGAGWVVYLVCVAGGYGMFVGLFAASLFVAVVRGSGPRSQDAGDPDAGAHVDPGDSGRGSVLHYVLSGAAAVC